MIYSPSTGFPHFIAQESQVPAEEAVPADSIRSTQGQLPALPKPGRPTHDSIDDWDTMLTALTARLRSAVGDSAALPASNAGARRIQDIVLECAADLDLLHIALRAESAQRRKLEASMDDSNVTMARAIVGIGESLHPAMPAKDKPHWGKRASAPLQDLRLMLPTEADRLADSVRQRTDAPAAMAHGRERSAQGIPMTFEEDIAALELRIAQEGEKCQAWRIAGPEEKYLEAYSMVEALELQLQRKLLQRDTGSAA